MGKNRYYRPQQIPKLRTPEECDDWLNRRSPRPVDVRYAEVWLARLGRHSFSCEQERTRPVLIVSNSDNGYANIVSVIPLTSQIKRTEVPSHIVIEPDSGFDGGCSSMALVEQMTSIDRKRLIKKMGEITNPETLGEIKRAVLIRLGMMEEEQDEEKQGLQHQTDDAAAEELHGDDGTEDKQGDGY
ncbi:MAG: type II toxin-antitoxin system PemK/MazF family toxin [Lachnospiraceae bacterium]|nr:type II toxin-antitoxin system PemK/MazF family toxin [Lachnospiraceae bacterium]